MSDEFFTGLVAARLRRTAAVRVEVRVPQRIRAAHGPGRGVDHVHEQRVRLLQSFFPQLRELEARPGRIETCTKCKPATLKPFKHE